MELHDIDDLPFHQHPAPFNMLATSDPHFNDGYFFAFYASDWYFVSGLRLHPNTNTMDGFAAVAHAGEQRCLRASRALRPRYTELAVGPLRLDITTTPIQRQRVVLNDNEGQFGFDVSFEPQAPVFLEKRYQHVKYGRIINDVLRYSQVCRATGTAHHDGQEIEVESWFGIRDHSWGLRARMGPSTRIQGIAPPASERDPRAFRLWVPFEAGDHCGFFHTHEDEEGETIDFEGRLDFRDGISVDLRSVKHDLRYESGRPLGGSIDLLDADGVVRHYELQASGSPADVQGLGYYGGWFDGASAGVYRGSETVEVERYPTGVGTERTGPSRVPVAQRPGATEHPSFITGPDGVRGMAHLEHSFLGRGGLALEARAKAQPAPAAGLRA
jgi:hypothetical protein